MALCIYCKHSNPGRTFTGMEHIFPESMGNEELVLPLGAVCDQCNNGILALLDDTLLKFEGIAFMRAYLGIPNKIGQLPTANFSNLRVERFPGNHMKMYFQGKGGFRLKRETPEEVEFDIEFKGRRYTDAHCKRLVRAFYKIGLGLVHYDHGYPLSFHPRYDEVRKIIQGEIDFHGYLAFGGKCVPDPRVHVGYTFVGINGTDVTAFLMSLFGLPLVFDLERRRLDDPTFLKSQGFNVITF